MRPSEPIGETRYGNTPWKSVAVIECLSIVMPGLVPGIHVFNSLQI
jgi:hypothetical protein